MDSAHPVTVTEALSSSDLMTTSTVIESLLEERNSPMIRQGHKSRHDEKHQIAPTPAPTVLLLDTKTNIHTVQHMLTN